MCYNGLMSGLSLAIYESRAVNRLEDMNDVVPNYVVSYGMT